jgi:hypothetical protein
MYAVLPDVDQALIDYLSSHPDLAPLHGGRVSTRLQSAATSVRVASLGGAGAAPWEGDDEFQVECWGGSQQQANLLARTVYAAGFYFRGPIGGGWSVGSQSTLRPLWSPDENGRPRYIVQIRTLVTPEEP